MNAQEFSTIAMAIRSAWPNANLMFDDKAKDVWYTMLADLDYNACLVAIKEHMSTCRFAPSIAELRERCSNVTSVPVQSWGDAWEDVISAIRFCGMYREDEALQRMDAITRKCVKRLGFQNLCTSENITADRANFRMIYEQEQKTQKELQQLSPALQEQKKSFQQLAMQTVKRLENKAGA